MAGKKTNTPFYHPGGILITQVNLNGGTVVLHAKIGKMNFDPIKVYASGDEIFQQIRAPKGSLKFIITGDSIADCSQ